VFRIYMAFIWGGWAASAGASLFALFAGRPNTPEELEIVRILGIALLFGVFLIVSFGKRIEMIYLNRQLPRPARITWWSYLVLALNVVFFGFFFLNFLLVQLTGTPLVRF
jgi:hypothetical protein